MSLPLGISGVQMSPPPRNCKTGEEYVEEFLDILGKEDCEETRREIRLAFGFDPIRMSGTLEDGTIIKDGCTISDIQTRAGMALDALEARQIDHDPNNYKHHIAWIEKMNAFKDVLFEVLESVKDPEVSQVLVGFAQTDLDHPSKLVLDKHHAAFQTIESIANELKSILDEDKKVGRPSLKKFYDFVYEIALLYKKLSGQEFGIYNNPSLGYKFVCLATEWMHDLRETISISDLRYTEKNIENACEKALARMNSAFR